MPTIKKILEESASRVSAEMKAEQIRLGFYATGDSARSLEGVATDESLRLLGAAHWDKQVKGGGNPRGTNANFADLVRWANKKPVIFPGKKPAQVAALVKYSLKRQGDLLSRGLREGIDLDAIIDREQPILEAELSKEYEIEFTKGIENGFINNG